MVLRILEMSSMLGTVMMSWDKTPETPALNLQVCDDCWEAETNRTTCRAARAKFLDLLPPDVLNVLVLIQVLCMIKPRFCDYLKMFCNSTNLRLNYRTTQRVKKQT